MHSYLKQFEPTIEFGTCDRPISFISITSLCTVSIYCCHGHHIRTKIYSTGEKTLAIAKRLQTWIDMSAG